MRGGETNRVLIGVILFMAILIGVQLVIIAALRESHTDQETNFQLYQQGASVRFMRLQEDLQNLNDRNYLLMQDLNSTQAQYKNAYEQLQAERQQVENTLRAIDEYHAEIQKRMAWFKENAMLKATPFPKSDPRNTESMKREIALNCARTNGGVCTIDMGCIARLNTDLLGIRYISDDERKVRERWDVADRLHSTDEMLIDGGGDCDDYSIFVKAEVNYLKTACGAAQPRIEGWSRGPGRYDSEYSNFSAAQPQKSDTAVPHPLAATSIYPNMVCGTFDGGASGHCMLAFTAKPVRTAGDIDNLDHAELIEPQTGEAKGRINDNYNVRLEKEIWVVASDDNLIFYSAKEDRWYDDTGFDRQLLKSREALTSMSSEVPPGAGYAQQQADKQ
jgi:hypothetical protein